MGKSINYFKSFSIALSLLILLQGCVVYQKNPVSLQEIALEKTRSKVEFSNGETHRFRYIAVKDSAFYGVKSISNKLVNIRLTESEIDAVYPKNKTVSTVLRVLGGALVFGVALMSY